MEQQQHFSAISLSDKSLDCCCFRDCDQVESGGKNSVRRERKEEFPAEKQTKMDVDDDCIANSFSSAIDVGHLESETAAAGGKERKNENKVFLLCSSPRIARSDSCESCKRKAAIVDSLSHDSSPQRHTELGF